MDKGLIRDDGDGPEERERRVHLANLLRSQVERLGVASGQAESLQKRKEKSVS